MSQASQLELNRCPHCHVDRPLLIKVWEHKTTTYACSNLRTWAAYACSRCGGVVLCAWRTGHRGYDQYPPNAGLEDESIPQRAGSYLEQAIASIHAPSGAVMLAACAVDAMLKSKGYKEGSLYTRVQQSVKDHLITEDMGKWAHEVRLDANEQRHTDEKVDLPSDEDAKRVVEFAKALATFLFVLPARVTRGITEAKDKGAKT